MLPHYDIFAYLRSNQYVSFLLNDACLLEKQQIHIVLSLVGFDWDTNPRSTTFEMSTLTITLLTRFKKNNWPPRYNWYIVESGVKHNTTKPIKPKDVRYDLPDMTKPVKIHPTATSNPQNKSY